MRGGKTHEGFWEFFFGNENAVQHMFSVQANQIQRLFSRFVRPSPVY